MKVDNHWAQKIRFCPEGMVNGLVDGDCLTEMECWHRGTSMSSKFCQSGLDDAERDRAATVGRCSGGSTGVTCQHSPH